MSNKAKGNTPKLSNKFMSQQQISKTTGLTLPTLSNLLENSNVRVLYVGKSKRPTFHIDDIRKLLE